jgi:hypothetical protein
MPGNVDMVMVYISDLATFNVFPTEVFMDYFFIFSDTDAPGVGFESVGVTNKSLILYLGPTFLIMHLMLFMYFCYSFVYLLNKYFGLLKWLEAKFRVNLKWKQLLLFLIESYFDFAVGILLRCEQPKFITNSDYYDFVITCIFTVVLAVLPIISYVFLWKY